MGKRKRKSHRPGHSVVVSGVLLLLMMLFMVKPSKAPAPRPPAPADPPSRIVDTTEAPTIRTLSNRVVTITCGETLRLQQAVRYADHIIIDCADAIPLYYTLPIQRDISISGTPDHTGILDGRADVSPMIEIYGGAKLTLFNLRLTNSRHDGIQLRENAKLTAIRCEMDQHGAPDGGAALWNRGGSVYLRNCLLRHNRSNDITAGIYNAANSTLTIEDSIIRSNSIRSYADAAGAALLNEGTAIIENTLFNRNVASHRGAAVVSLGGKITLRGAVFSSNYAHWQGGAIYNAPSSEMLVYSSVFMDNHAPHGAAIWNTSTLDIYNSDLTNDNFFGCHSSIHAQLHDPDMVCIQRNASTWNIDPQPNSNVAPGTVQSNATDHQMKNKRQ